MSSKSICIIGAGLAGIAAANELNSKYDIDIYDSMNYVGGRVNSDEFGIKGAVSNVELGAQWMHSLGYNKLYRIVRDNLTKSYFEAEANEEDISEKKDDEEKGEDDDEEGEGSEESEESMFAEPEATMFARDIACNKVPKDVADIYFGFLEEIDNLKDEDYEFLDDSYGTFIQNQIDKSITDDFGDESDNLQKWVRALFTAMKITIDGSDDLNRTSLNSQNWLEGTDSGEKLMKFPLRNLINFLSEKIQSKIFLRHIVEHIQTTMDGKLQVVIRRCIDNTFVIKTYDYVVSTIPIEAFKVYARNLLNTSLYEQLNMPAWQQVQGGKFEKVFVEFDSSVVPSAENKRLWVMLGNEYDNYDTDWSNKMILLQQLDEDGRRFMFYLTHKNAELMVNESLEEIKAKIMQRISASTDKTISNIINISRTNWHKQTWIQCSYSFVHTNPDDDVFDQITKPLVNENGKEVVFFAGEHTCKAAYGTMHGAYESGLKAAERIIKSL